MTVDLSKMHSPIGTLFSTDRSDADFEMSKDQVEFFHEFGYVKGIRALNDQQITQLREELEQLLDPTHDGAELWYEYHSNESLDPNGVLFHALGAWRLREGFHDILWNRAVTIPASQLLAGPVRFWHDQLFCKPAHHGGVVAWHQDYSYWTRTIPMAHLTCWIGLDDSDRENGCLQYIPGSHKWDLLPNTGLAGDMNAIQAVLTDKQWEEFQNPVAVELKQGECAFHHPLMVHGSFENRTDRPRRAVVLNFFADGVKSNSNDTLLSGVPVVPKGEQMRGQFFPIVYAP